MPMVRQRIKKSRKGKKLLSKRARNKILAKNAEKARAAKARKKIDQERESQINAVASQRIPEPEAYDSLVPVIKNLTCKHLSVPNAYSRVLIGEN